MPKHKKTAKELGTWEPEAEPVPGPEFEQAHDPNLVPEELGGCCLHTSSGKTEIGQFKRALKKLGIAHGFIHNSCFGLLNHLDTGEEYRWQGGAVQQFDRDAYEWRNL